MHDRAEIDKMIVTKCFVDVKEYCRSRREMKACDEETCVRLALDTLKSEFRRIKGYRQYQALSKEDFRELNDLYNRVWHEVESKTRSMVMGFAAKKKTQYIMRISSEAMIRASMAEKGFPLCTVESQSYRAKVSVSLPSGHEALFYISYKDIMADKLEEREELFIGMCRQIESLPFTMKIW